jgi:predicted CxxxxCH...CXXCH cytochrome family protein
MPIHRLATLALVAVVTAGCGSAREVKDPRGANQNAFGCDRCHGYPPAPGFLAESSAHPQGDRVVASCSYCHPQTVMADNHTLIPVSKGGRHQNGKVDFVHGHLPSVDGVSYGDPSQHVPDALSGLTRAGPAQNCYTCHGADLDGGIGVSCVACHIAPHGDARFPTGVADFRTNCTFCHGQAKVAFNYDTDLKLAAPPVALYPFDPQDEAIGAHQEHLNTANSTTVALAASQCSLCHKVPPGTFPGSLDHIDGATVPVFTGVAITGGAAATFDEATLSCANYCHGATLNGGTNRAPKWTDGAQDCASCHGSPPPTGGDVGWHAFHVDARGLDCGKCHPGYVKNTTANPALHVNGTVEVSVVGTTGVVAIPVNNLPDHSWSNAQCEACHTALGLPIPPGH